MGTLRRGVKVLASRILPDSEKLRYLAYLPKLEAWRRLRAASVPEFGDRLALYDHVHSTVLGGGPLTYLEFGVYRGDSIRYWSQLDRHPSSRFVGFDTFTGLPDDWRGFTGGQSKGTFDVGGRAPDVLDSRVSFVTDLFQDTLAGFLAGHALQPPLVVHVDCDLYSSALYLLARCDDALVPGSLVLFDEFSSILDEFRSLEDYCSAFQRSYEVVGVVPRGPEFSYYQQIAIRMT